VAGKKPKAGAPSWMVTFADMMALLLCLFVLLLSFSEMDAAKFKSIAGEMEQAFGLALKSRLMGMIEFEGSPERRAYKDIRIQGPKEFIPLALPPTAERADETSDAQMSAEEQIAMREQETFDQAHQSILQAMKSNGKLEEFSDQIRIDMTREGMRIQVVDQDGGSMFVGGTAEFNEQSLAVLNEIAAAIGNLPNDIAIAGHTDASLFETREGYSNWELSSDRAHASRRALRDAGIAPDRFARIVGKADQEPLNAEDPMGPENRRISIILLREAPVLPPSLQKD